MPSIRAPSADAAPTWSCGHPGPRNSLTDVPGIRVGHHTAVGDGYLTGTTVVLAPDGGMVAGVDVRGGGPATHETDLLHPTASVERIHALVLTGGSAYGLAACTGVMNALADRGIGLPVGPEPGEVVPLVPGVAVFDLGRGGDFRARPTAEFGALALHAAFDSWPDAEPAATPTPTTGFGRRRHRRGDQQSEGRAGHRVTGAARRRDGRGAGRGQRRGLADRPQDRRTARRAICCCRRRAAARGTGGVRPGGTAGGDGTPAAENDLLGGRQRGNLRRQDQIADRADDIAAATISNTTLVVVATDATLTKAQCTKLAAVAQNGMARALNPVHTMFDGDVIFGVSTAAAAAPDPLGFHQIVVAGADVVTRAIVRALLGARHTEHPGRRVAVVVRGRLSGVTVGGSTRRELGRLLHDFVEFRSENRRNSDVLLDDGTVTGWRTAGRCCAAAGWILWVVVQIVARDPFPPEISLSQYGLGGAGWLFSVWVVVLASQSAAVAPVPAGARVRPGGCWRSATPGPG